MGAAQICVVYPFVGKPHSRIALGACRFIARSGEGDDWPQEPIAIRQIVDPSGSRGRQ
jgi:hypothetical protein